MLFVFPIWLAALATIQKFLKKNKAVLAPLAAPIPGSKEKAAVPKISANGKTPRPRKSQKIILPAWTIVTGL